MEDSPALASLAITRTARTAYTLTLARCMLSISSKNAQALRADARPGRVLAVIALAPPSRLDTAEHEGQQVLTLDSLRLLHLSPVAVHVMHLTQCLAESTAALGPLGERTGPDRGQPTAWRRALREKADEKAGLCAAQTH